jgi:hypothetical protein
MSKNIPLNTRGDESLCRRIDDWRRAQKTIPSRADAMRVLMERGLDAERPSTTTESAA